MAGVTLEQWRMLKAVVEHGGFAQAATAVHKSQSSINHAIHKLEDLLGVKLLEVRGRKAYLTGKGELLLKRAELLLAHAENLQSLAGSLSAGQELELKIGVDQAYPSSLLAKALAQFSDAYPGTRVEVYETVLSGAAEMQENQEVDLVISSEPVADRLGEQLLNVRFIAVSNPHHPLQQLDRQVTEDDLRLHRQVVLRDSAQKNDADAGWLGADERWTVGQLQTSIDIIGSGFGYAWLPESRVAEHVASGRLKPLSLPAGGSRQMSLTLYLTDPDSPGPAVSHLAELLRAVSKENRDDT